MTARMSREPAWTWELNAYGRGNGFHYARRRSDDGVERHPDGQPCQCPNAAAYAPVTLASVIAWWALAFAAFDSTYPPRDGDSPSPAEVMVACLLAPWQFIRYVLPPPFRLVGLSGHDHRTGDTPMMPPIPAVIHLPTDHRDGYYPAAVVAAIPIAVHSQKPGSMYAVTAIEPTSSPTAPAFLTAEVMRGASGFWFADETTEPADLTSALARMCDLAGRPGCPSGI